MPNFNDPKEDYIENNVIKKKMLVSAFLQTNLIFEVI